MFELKGRVARNAKTDLEDSGTIKMAMTALGYYDDTKTGFAPYGDDQLFQSIKMFQTDNGLKVDGVINPNGPTQRTIRENLTASPQAAGAFKDFVKNWWDMREDGTIGSDKYFHCKANFEATRRGWAGKASAEKLSDLREVYGRWKRDYSPDDELKDQNANEHGRNMAASENYKTAEEACAIFRVKGINERY